MKSTVLQVALCIFLLAGSALAQRPCPPGQTCRVQPLPVQGWRAAAPAPRQQVSANPAIVRVGCTYGNITDYGSGTIIDRRGKLAYVLTCWHTLRDGGSRGKAFVLVHGRRYWARVLHTDRTWDVAVLAIQDPGIAPILMAAASPTKGQVMLLAGLGQGSYRQVSGQLRGYATPQGATSAQWMTVAAGSRMGDSGGPVLYRGRVVGLVSATSGYVSYGPCLPRLRMILRAVLPPYPRRPGVIVPKPVVVVPVSPPVLPTPAPPPPATPDPPPTITTSILDYDKLAEAILERLDLATLKGPKGDPGDKGDTGDKGDAGDAGLTPAIDLDDLAAKVLAKLDEGPLFSVIHRNPETGQIIPQVDPLTGETFTTQEVRRGDTYVLYLFNRSDLQVSP